MLFGVPSVNDGITNTSMLSMNERRSSGCVYKTNIIQRPNSWIAGVAAANKFDRASERISDRFAQSRRHCLAWAEIILLSQTLSFDDRSQLRTQRVYTSSAKLLSILRNT